MAVRHYGTSWVSGSVMESGPAGCGGFGRQLDPKNIAYQLIDQIGSAKWVSQRGMTVVELGKCDSWSCGERRRRKEKVGGLQDVKVGDVCSFVLQQVAYKKSSTGNRGWDGMGLR